MNNNYIKIIEEAIDKGHTKYGEIFQYMAQSYLNHKDQFSDRTAPENFKDMFEAMDSYFVTDASKLDKHQLEYRQKVVDRFNHDKDEFGGEYDKMKHFLKGAYLGSNYGDTLGILAGWGAEKVDTIKYIKGEIAGNRQPHQIGFSWKDYAYTKAGSHLGDYLSDLNEKDALAQMQKIASGSINIATIYTPTGIKENGVGKFDPIVSPGFETTADKVDETIDDMMKKITHNIVKTEETQTPATPKERTILTENNTTQAEDIIRADENKQSCSILPPDVMVPNAQIAAFDTNESADENNQSQGGVIFPASSGIYKDAKDLEAIAKTNTQETQQKSSDNVKDIQKTLQDLYPHLYQDKSDEDKMDNQDDYGMEM